MKNRLSKLQASLQTNTSAAVLVSSVPNITYLTGFSGFSKEDRDAFLFITKEKPYLLTHGIYKEVAEKHIANFELMQITREDPPGKTIKKLIRKHAVTKLGYEHFDLKVAEYHAFCKQIDPKLLSPINLLTALRIIKTAEEIQLIKKACELGDKAFSYIIKKLKAGMTEKEVASDIDVSIKKLGGDSSFPTIVAFGSNASRPHHVPTERKLQLGDMVLLDFGAKLNNYCSDMTRTICFGKPTAKQKKVYQTVLAAQLAAIEYIVLSLLRRSQMPEWVQESTRKQYIKASQVDKIARNFIISKGFPNMPHSLGHGIGLEVHEAPRLSPSSKDVLKEGMVFSIEPGIYLADEMGVRIEDLFAIQDNQLIQLTNAPRELIEI